MGPTRAAVRFGMLLLCFSFVGACAAAGTPHEATDPQREAMLRELRPMQITSEGVVATHTPIIRAYYSEVTAGLPGVSHDTGTFEALGAPMVMHVFAPAGTARGTIFAVHGYLAYPLQMAALIRAAVQHGYVVVVPELPGHALSGGERAFIADFADYAVFFRAVVRTVAGAAPRPWHAVGHSTGASTLYEYMQTVDDPFAAVVFAAPLIRSKYYRWSRAARFLSRPVVDTVPTGYSGVMAVERMPLDWFDAQVAWNARVDRYPVLQRSVLILQGTADRVVSWRYNRRYFERHVARVDYRTFEGAGHVLYRESGVRDQAVAATLEFIEAAWR